MNDRKKMMAVAVEMVITAPSPSSSLSLSLAGNRPPPLPSHCGSTIPNFLRISNAVQPISSFPRSMDMSMSYYT